HLTTRALQALFAVWFVAWFVVFVVHRWSFIDTPLWVLENLLHVVDFADIMESFNLRLHDLPRDWITGTLTFFCRLWIAIGIAVLLGKKKVKRDRRLATPPEVRPWPYWSRRVGVLAAMLMVMLTTGVLGYLVLGSPVARLANTVAD